MGEGVTEAQAFAIKTSEFGGVESHYCKDSDLVRKSTLRALVRKGYLSDDAAPWRWWLTEKGEELRERLVYETCQSCGANTHREEAACVACGASKDSGDALLAKLGGE